MFSTVWKSTANLGLWAPNIAASPLKLKFCQLSNVGARGPEACYQCFRKHHGFFSSLFKKVHEYLFNQLL